MSRPLMFQKKNNLGPIEKICYIWGLKGLIFILQSHAGPQYIPLSIPNVSILRNEVIYSGTSKH